MSGVTRAIIRDLAAFDPLDSGTTFCDGTVWCFLCEADSVDDGSADSIVHSDDCPWRRAREVIDRLDP